MLPRDLEGTASVAEPSFFFFATFWNVWEDEKAFAVEGMKRDEKNLSLSFMCKFIDQSSWRAWSLKKSLWEEMNGGRKEMYKWEGPAGFAIQRKYLE